VGTISKRATVPLLQKKEKLESRNFAHGIQQCKCAKPIRRGVSCSEGAGEAKWRHQGESQRPNTFGNAKDWGLIVFERR